MSRSRTPFDRWMAPGRRPLANSLCSRTSMRWNFSPAAIFRRTSSMEISCTRARTSSTSFRNPGEWCTECVMRFPLSRDSSREMHATKPKAPATSGQIAPVGSLFDFDAQGNGERIDVLEHCAQRLGELGHALLRHLEQQFVMHLQDHPCRHAVALQVAIDFDHRKFHQVGCGALDGRVECGAFSQAALRRNPRLDFGQRAQPAEQRPRHARSTYLGQMAVEVFADTAIALEIALDEACCLAGLDAELLGQSVSRQTRS